ncbi:hypothetical protein XF_2584 [Xylella fastidiosa 9a5c]|uniref:Uncharacterized protein n=1 Tax=Xylella fastidiosa (strain 9a5c) TaxID=160492 RepID=Q9PAD4_XYLFA|nr:hypothetical protein XF_2584 [Xylella fastidiosa 9a5c]
MVLQDISYICALFVLGGVRMLIVLAQFGADRWGRYCRRRNLLRGMLNTLRWVLYVGVISMLDPYSRWQLIRERSNDSYLFSKISR